MNPILVTGATGNVGRQVVHQLLARGLRVRALVRDPDRAAQLLPVEVEIAIGDFADRDSLASALIGVDRLFLTSANGPDQVAHETAVIDTAAAAAVNLIVKLSTLGAEVGSPLPGLDWHGRIEQHLQRSGVPSVVLRSNLFMSNLLANADSVVGGRLLAPAAHARASFVDPADIAAVAAAVLADGQRGTDPLVLTGPTAISYTEIAAVLSAVTGRRVDYVPLAPDQAHEALLAQGLPPWLVAHLHGAFRLLRAGTFEAVTDVVPSRLGRPARTLADWAEDHAAAFGVTPAAPGHAAPADVARRFLDLVNAGDLEGLAHLYEPTAVLHWPAGQVTEGLPGIREVLAQLLTARPTMTGDVDHVLQSGNLALASGHWTMTGTSADGPFTATGRTADVLRRQPDGTWRMVIDSPIEPTATA
jgi:uncharacterized protein YbjT (DUF2867 family)/ketosteroid isomerase-like protein